MVRQLVVLSLLIALFAGRASGGEHAAIEAIKEEHESAIAKLGQEREERIVELKSGYEAALAKAAKEALARGDLDEVLAIEEERKNIAEPSLAKGKTSELTKGVAALRSKLDVALVRLLESGRAREIKLLEAYAAKLQEVQDDYVKARKIEAALAARSARTPVIERLKKLKSAAPQLVKKPDPPTPDPPRRSGKPEFERVASKVQAKRGVDTASSKVVAFEGPTGDGRRGAKGILVTTKSDSDDDIGSTWTFIYTRGGSARGLQIIHPRGRGQAIVHINRNGVGLSTPGEWRRVGYGGGSSEGVREKDSFGEVFPLKDNQEYTVLSRMSENGSGELFIDGKLVATVRAKSAKPLSLEIAEGQKFPGASGWDKLAFKGEGLPLEWAKGSAGILLGPLDSGIHLCREVKFCHGLAEVPTQ